MLEAEDELERLARMQQRDRRQQKEPPPDNAPPEGLNEWDAGDDTDPPPPREWLLGNAFCRRFLSSLLGDGGVGKSAMRVAQAMALATGRALTGEFVHKRTKVLIVSLEDDAEELRRRVLAARIHHVVSAAELKDWLFLAAPNRGVGKLMMLNPKGRVVEGALGKTLEDVIVRREIGLIILDPFVKTHSVPENLNNEMDSVAQLLSDLAAKHNVAVDFPHHVSKGTADPGNANRGRGATATVNAGRLVYTLGTMTPDEAKLLGVQEDQRRQHVRLDRAKLNIARASGLATWFRLVGVRLGNTTADYPAGDEVQTVEPWKPPETWADLPCDLLNRSSTSSTPACPMEISTPKAIGRPSALSGRSSKSLCRPRQRGSAARSSAPGLKTRCWSRSTMTARPCARVSEASRLIRRRGQNELRY